MEAEVEIVFLEEGSDIAVQRGKGAICLPWPFLARHCRWCFVAGALLDAGSFDVMSFVSGEGVN